MTEHELLMMLVDEQIALLKERNLTPDEALVIGATVNDEYTIERFGEIEAVKIANEAIRKSKNSDEVFRNVKIALDIQPQNVIVETD